MVDFYEIKSSDANLDDRRAEEIGGGNAVLRRDVEI